MDFKAHPSSAAGIYVPYVALVITYFASQWNRVLGLFRSPSDVIGLWAHQRTRTFHVFIFDALSSVVSRAGGLQGEPKSQVCCLAQGPAGGICHRDRVLPGESPLRPLQTASNCARMDRAGSFS